jgi:hypothetical protein
VILRDFVLFGSAPVSVRQTDYVASGDFVPLRAGEALFLFLPPFEKEEGGGFSFFRS